MLVRGVQREQGEGRGAREEGTKKKKVKENVLKGKKWCEKMVRRETGMRRNRRQKQKKVREGTSQDRRQAMKREREQICKKCRGSERRRV